MSVKTPHVLRNYTGYARELLTYSTYYIRPKHNPETKFVIFTVGRTGSNLLVSLLNSHPEITCHGELLYKKVAYPQLYIRCKEKLVRQNVFGFKLLLYNFGVQNIFDPRPILDDMVIDGYKIINLKRRNLLRQTISHMLALYRKTFHQERGDAQLFHNQMIVDFSFFQEELELFIDHRRREEELLKDFSYLRLDYEDDLLPEKNHQVTVDKIAQYLGIPTASVISDFGKTTPQDLSNVIENYEEFTEYLEGMNYSHYLNED